MEAEARVRIPNATGLHARPCHAVVALALQFDCTLRIELRGREVDGRSILHLMTLAAGQGDELYLKATGADAERLVENLTGLIERGFEESS